MCSCKERERERAKLWQDILSLGFDIFMYVITQDLFVLTNLFLGADVAEFIQLLSERRENFKSICILNLHKKQCRTLLTAVH